MIFKSSAAFTLGVGLLIAPVGASATLYTELLQADVSASGIVFHDLLNGVEQFTHSCGTSNNCSQSSGFYLASPSAAVNSTVNFNVYKPDGTTLIDYGTASFFYESNGMLEDYTLSVISGLGSPLTSPFTTALSLIETGAYQTVSSISGVPGDPFTPVNSDTRDRYDVSLQFRDVSDVPEPGTIALFGSGVLALVGFGRRRTVRA